MAAKSLCRRVNQRKITVDVLIRVRTLILYIYIFLPRCPLPGTVSPTTITHPTAVTPIHTVQCNCPNYSLTGLKCTGYNGMVGPTFSSIKIVDLFHHNVQARTSLDDVDDGEGRYAQGDGQARPLRR
jgi:hypothetical protein